MYDGESIIIRNAVAFVCLLAALSFSRSSLGVVFFLSLLHKFQVASQFLCCNRNVKHGRSAFRLHQARAAFSDSFFVV